MLPNQTLPWRIASDKSASLPNTSIDASQKPQKLLQSSFSPAEKREDKEDDDDWAQKQEVFLFFWQHRQIYLIWSSCDKRCLFFGSLVHFFWQQQTSDKNRHRLFLFLFLGQKLNIWKYSWLQEAECNLSRFKGILCKAGDKLQRRKQLKKRRKINDTTFLKKRKIAP